MLCLGLKDPFAPVQNLTCTIFFGGIVDAMKSAITKPTEPVSLSGASGNSASGVSNPRDPSSQSTPSGGGEGNSILNNNLHNNVVADKKRD